MKNGYFARTLTMALTVGMVSISVAIIAAPGEDVVHDDSEFREIPNQALALIADRAPPRPNGHGPKAPMGMIATPSSRT